MSANKIDKQFRQILENFISEKPKEASWHFLVACSGGADSLALWQLLLKNKRPNDELTVLHIWHNLRPEAEAEYRTLEKQVRNYNSRFLAFKVDVVAYGKKYQLSEEVAARELRRLAFAWACSYYAWKSQNKTHVYLSLAQHLDDQAETVLAHSLKGTGLRGLSGIWQLKEHKLSMVKLREIMKEGYLELIVAPESEDADFLTFLGRELSTVDYTAWRPLLAFSKSTLLSYISNLRLCHAEDQSNKDTQYERNYLRQIILPSLQNKFPQASVKLAELATISQKQLLALDYLLQSSKDLTGLVRNLSDLVKLPTSDSALAISWQTASQQTASQKNIPEEVLIIYWQRLLAKYLPDLLLSYRQQLEIAKFINKARHNPSKKMQFLILQKEAIAVLIDSCLILYQSPDLVLADKHLDKDLVLKKCRPFLYEHYGLTIPLQSNWQRYFSLTGQVAGNLELRAASEADYLLIAGQKKLNLYEYFARLPLPKALYQQIMVLANVNSRHVQHIFYKRLAKGLLFQPK